MYAIVEIAGLQYRVEKDQQLLVNRLVGDEGDVVSFDKVLLTDNGTVQVGAPVIEGVAVEAKIVEHLKGDKVIVFKKKRRKGYRKKNGHRQYLTKIEIVGIGAGGAGTSKKKEAKAEPKKEVEKPAAKPAAKEVKSDAKVAAKKEAPKEKVEKSTKKETSTKDDLKLIEGIGPKAAEALNNAGVLTFADLAAKSADDIKTILTEASSRLASLDPTTWAQQAQMAADGKMDELKTWQDELKGGKEVK